MSPKPGRRSALAFSLTALALLPACGVTDGSPVTVAAASSLSAAFHRIEIDFEDGNEVDVVLNLAGSGSLREQILAGAPVDVFASANMANMGALVDAGLVSGEPRIFARNRLVIAVPAGNPGGVLGLDDLARADLLVGLCVGTAPCGELARDLLEQSGIEPALDTEEPDVGALVTKLSAAELDVGLIYASDVVGASGAVEAIGEPLDASTDYPIAVLRDAEDPEAAAAFVEHVLSTEGQGVLRALGFETP